MRENIFTPTSVQASVPTFAALSAKNSCTATQSAFQASGLNSGKHLTGLTRLASLLLAPLVLTALLAACGGGGSSGSSGGGGASGIQVTNLKAIPGSSSLTLTWDNPNANISSFDIEVRNLATNERVGAVSQANRTISSSPAVNTTAPLAKVRYTISSGLVDNSNYSVAVTVNLQGADAGRATSARGLSGRRYLPANGVRIGANTDEDQYANVEDNCPAIKNDDQANTYGGADNIGDACGDIDSDTIVDADDNCVDVANTDQRDTIGNGIGDACDSTDDGDGIANDLDNCPFTANTNQEDGDGDNVGDICDVDADGDGLIELSTAAELNMMRHNLGGTGLDADNMDNNNNGGGDDTGCGGLLGITTCNGYEQMANIDLEDLGRDATGSNWEPVGFCTSSPDPDMPGRNIIECAANTFTGIFSGNNFTISNMFIHITTNSSGVGFFGALSSAGQLRNMHIRGGNITRTEVISQYVGGLVGYSNSPTVNISNSLVTLDEISATSNVGGLVGFSIGATISSSVTTVGSIIGVNNVGGLVGRGDGATISSSVTTVGSIIGENAIGGLVGDGQQATISSSLATVGSISGAIGVGGLVGFGGDAIISSSVAVTNSITSTSGIGGLVGFSAPLSTTDSYWDSRVSFVNPADNTAGSAQTTAALTTPTDFTGTNNVYTTWANAYCNPNTGEYRETAPSPLGDFIRVWDLGTASEYPAITCAQNLFSLADQREASRRVLAGESPIQ